MRVLMSTPADPVRLANLVPLGWALRTAGHGVLVATEPGFAAAVNRTGLVALDAGEQDDLDGAGGARRRARLVEIAEFWRADLVLADRRTPGAVAAAAQAGIPAVRVGTLLDGCDETGAFDAFDEPDDHAGLDEARDGSAAFTALDPTPMSLRRAAPTGRPGLWPLDAWPIRPSSYTFPEVIPAWLARPPRRARVLLALAGDGGGADVSLSEVFAALDALDAEVICLLPVDSVPSGATLPAAARLFDSLPLEALVPTCAAVVHDGRGPAVAAAALLHGTPQLVLGAEDIGGIAGLLDDAGRRERAERLRAEVAAMPSAQDVVGRLEMLVG
jgi:UDP:flavonoid glycosyltransferase YjiC (YdhE family)